MNNDEAWLEEDSTKVEEEKLQTLFRKITLRSPIDDEAETAKLINEFKTKKIHLVDKYNKASYVKKVDKMLFIVGAVGLQLNYFFLGMFPNDFIFVWHLI